MTADTILIYSYYFTGGALFLLALLGLAVSAKLAIIDKHSRRFFVSSFFILVLSIIAYLTDLLVFSDPYLASIEKIASFFETLLPFLLMPILSAYILHCCEEKLRNSVLFNTELVLWFMLFALLCVSQFTKDIYYITPDNQFVRGRWYPLLIFPMLALMLVNLAGVIRRRKKLTKKYFIAFLLYLIPPMIAMIIQAFATVFLLIVIAVSISAFSMFWIIITDQHEQYIRQQKEIADQRTRITMLQMRPHFIYNTMMSIYYLCEQNPRKGQQVIMDFITYLRKNFNAIASNTTIPFLEELEHTRAYLAVEQAQFDDILFVEYDTPQVQFRIPPLTLQPIVENSVKHGMDPDFAEPLRIFIKTEITKSENKITVSDNGPGFKMTGKPEAHMALDNIRFRLESIGGQLTIDSGNNGTKVVITVPKNVR